VTVAYVGLGANLGDRAATIRRAAALIGTSRLSTIRETEPWGLADQPLFLNAVAEVETELSPRALLQLLLRAEQELGRIREGAPRYGPRPIDLDLLLYGGEIIEEPGLIVPHPHLHERRFVLEPLSELNAGLLVPGLGEVSSLLAALD
jgi:2-amino-4-hydroxy-6-hydroxymethyldihydropteridine diphosphokinase